MSTRNNFTIMLHFVANIRTLPYYTVLYTCYKLKSHCTWRTVGKCGINPSITRRRRKREFFYRQVDPRTRCAFLLRSDFTGFRSSSFPRILAVWRCEIANTLLPRARDRMSMISCLGIDLGFCRWIDEYVIRVIDDGLLLRAAAMSQLDK